MAAQPPAAAGSPPSGGVLEDTTETRATERKLRSAIESILRDQEELRITTPLASGRTVYAIGSAIGLGALACVSATAPILAGVLLPAIASGIFTYTSMAECSGMRSKGMARYNSAQAVLLTSRQEAILAMAEREKAFLPFGVGLTGIVAAACVTLSLFNNNFGEFIPEDSVTPVLLAGDDFVLGLLAVCSVAGALVTSDRNLCMVTLLKPPKTKRPDAPDDDTSEWEKSSLTEEAQQPDPLMRAFVGLVTLLVCFLPLPFTVGSLFDGLAALWAGILAVSNSVVGASDESTIKMFQDLFDETCVVISATAAAQAAFVLLVAEKDFADAERRIAIQCKQAALAELFYAQSQAEAAVIPMNTALSGAALGGASVAVEFSKGLGALAIWPGVLSTFRSTLSSVLARVEANASWIELEVSRKGLKPGSTTKRPDALSSSLRELERLQYDFRADEFSDSVRKTLEELPVGGVQNFGSLSRSRRRKVHLVAAELGMMSQSLGPSAARVVTVTKGPPGGVEGSGGEMSRSISDQLQDQLRAVVAEGLPEESKPVAAAGTLAVLTSVTLPFVPGTNIATLVLPLVTGSVGLLTVWQERVGKEACAIAKRQSAKICQKLARTEILLGRSILVYGGLPVEFAVGAFGATSSVICVSGLRYFPWMAALLPAALLVAVVPCQLAVLRQRRIERNVEKLAQECGGPPVKSRSAFRKRWWALPLGLAILLPCGVPRRVAMVCCGSMMQIGFFMAFSSEHLAYGELYSARCSQVFAAADGWANSAQKAIRELPPYSAVATITTLLSTAFTAFYAPASVYLPVLGLITWIRAVQNGNQASAGAPLVASMAESLQDITQPSPWQYSAQGVLARRLPAGQAMSRPVRVTIIGARSLRAADFLGYSDPYCICEIPGKPWARTRTIVIENTLDPIWNHQWEVPDFSPGDSLTFSVFDEDQNDDDFLGRATLSYAQFQSGFDADVPLMEAGAGIKAFLRVRVTAVSESLPGISGVPGVSAQVEPMQADSPQPQHEFQLSQLPQGVVPVLEAKKAGRPRVEQLASPRTASISLLPEGVPNKLHMLKSWRPGRTSVTFAKMVDEDMEPNSLYGAPPARVAVNSVQAQLDEIRLSVRTSESAWFETLRTVGFFAAAACISPFALSALATEVALPVLGAGLTLFVVAAEAEARTKASTSKVWAAEVHGVKATMEEMLSIACLFRSRLLAAAGFTAAAAVMAVVAESPWPIVAAFPKVGRAMQTAWQVVLASSSVGVAVWTVGPLQGVFNWARRIAKLSLQKLREARTDGKGPGAQRRAALELLRSPWWSASGKGPLPFLFGLLPLVCVYLPPGRAFAKRATACTAASSFVVAVALFQAEVALAKAERATAGRLRTYALTDAFANEAEQQGALLPVASAATIALSGFITFGVEVNPYIAATLAISQAIVWVIASRKAISTKFEVDASLQVNSVTESPLMGVFGIKSENGGEEILRRVKRALLKFATMRQ